MSYGLRYFILFKNRDLDTVRINLLQKNYTGSIVDELEASGNPLEKEYPCDNNPITQVIRGSSARIQYWNNAATSIETFADPEDDKWKVEVYITSQYGTHLDWVGYIVQDEDSDEEFMPVPNLVTLKATDNLALLKDISLKDALDASTSRDTIYSSGSVSITVGDNPPIDDLIGWTGSAPTIQAGDQIVISGGTSFDGTYDVIGGTQIGTSNLIRVSQNLSNDSGTGVITVRRQSSIFNKLREITYINTCLNNTGLELGLNIYCNVFENGMDDRAVDPVNEPFSQSRLSGKTFIKSSEYDDCYTVLEKILAAWKCTLFQANGEWQIVRWLEAKQFNNAIPGTHYDYGLASPTAVTLSVQRDIGLNYPIEPINANQVKSIVRSNKHTRLQFNYEQPYQLILNHNFSELGSLIRTYTSGTDTIKEYTIPHWSNSSTQYPAGASFESFIRVVTNNLGVETGRYAVVKSDVGSIVSTPFEVNAGDKFTISWRFKTSDSQAGNVNSVFVVKLTNGSSTYYLDEDGTWDATVGATFTTPSGQNTQDWQSVSFTSNSMPIDGELSVFLHQCDLSAPYNETIYTDLNIDYTYAVNDQTNVIGHIHKSVQNLSIKKSHEETIFVDDSPKNNLRGCQFLDDSTTKTTSWHRGGSTEQLQFGFIQKTDLLFVTDSFRKRIEGDFRGLKDNSSYLHTLLNIFQFDQIAGTYFILGQCKFDYKTGIWTGTLEELWNTSETYDVTAYNNTFTYIYSTQ